MRQLVSATRSRCTRLVATFYVMTPSAGNNTSVHSATDSLGTIEVGELVDLIVLERDPLSDIANTLSVTRVFRDGIEHRRTTPLVPESYMRTSPRR
jgi:predicted amidohydrolase YtcJ